MGSGLHSRPGRFAPGWITLGLGIGGAVAGAIAGLALTPLGKIVAGAPPADWANYLWNACAFGIMGAVAAPAVIWSSLRRVPLWRTITEPLLGAIVGMGTGVLLGSGALFLLLMPVGAAAAVTRLHLTHRPRARQPIAALPHRSSDRLA
jgi:hypothetical protein